MFVGSGVMKLRAESLNAFIKVHITKMRRPAEPRVWGNAIMINLSAEGGHFESASRRDDGCRALGGLVRGLHLCWRSWGDQAQSTKRGACWEAAAPLGTEAAERS